MSRNPHTLRVFCGTANPELAEEIIKKKPQIGYLTISNALQWRLQYKRVIEEAGKINGVNRIL